MRAKVTAMAALLALSISITACSGGNSQATQDSATSSSVASAVQSEEATTKDLEIVESGYHIGDRGYLQYGIKLHNPNASLAAKFPVVHVTCKDAAGAILSSDDWTISEILPGETAVFASQAGNGSLPGDAQVEFSVSVDKKKWKEAEPEATEPYTIDGLNRVEGTFGASYVGQITVNVDDEDYAKPQIVLILRDADGNIIYGTSTYVNGELAKDTPSAFEINAPGAPEAASFEVYANPWM